MSRYISTSSSQLGFIDFTKLPIIGPLVPKPPAPPPPPKAPAVQVTPVAPPSALPPAVPVTPTAGKAVPIALAVGGVVVLSVMGWMLLKK